ncbi:MAG: peptidylprolyl isomerase [Candidatus Hydrothermarchaeaceae archaeon]
MTDDVISDGDSVTVNYTGNYENGEIFDSSIEEKAKESGFYNPERKYEPLCIKLGTGQIIKGFEGALRGMKKGEEKEVTIPPEEAYGNVDSSLVQTVPMDAFKEAKISPEVGLMLNTQTGVGKITKVTTEDVELDFNSPMAGKTLVFNIKVEDIEKWDGKEDCDDSACGSTCGGCSGQ